MVVARRYEDAFVAASFAVPEDLFWTVGSRQCLDNSNPVVAPAPGRFASRRCSTPGTWSCRRTIYDRATTQHLGLGERALAPGESNAAGHQRAVTHPPAPGGSSRHMVDLVYSSSHDSFETQTRAHIRSHTQPHAQMYDFDRLTGVCKVGGIQPVAAARKPKPLKTAPTAALAMIIMPFRPRRSPSARRAPVAGKRREVGGTARPVAFDPPLPSEC